jgi:hypothetical protein
VAKPSSSKTAEPTAPVDEKISDLAPAVGMGNLYIATAQALTLAMHNAVAAQQQTNIAAQSATAQAVALLLGVHPPKPPAG